MNDPQWTPRRLVLRAGDTAGIGILENPERFMSISMGRAIRYYPEQPALSLDQSKLHIFSASRSGEETHRRIERRRFQEGRSHRHSASQRTGVYRTRVRLQLARCHRRPPSTFAFR